MPKLPPYFVHQFNLLYADLADCLLRKAHSESDIRACVHYELIFEHFMTDTERAAAQQDLISEFSKP